VLDAPVCCNIVIEQVYIPYGPLHLVAAFDLFIHSLSWFSLYFCTCLLPLFFSPITIALSGGFAGRIRLGDTTSTLNALLNNPPGEMIALVMNPGQVTKANLDSIKSKLKVAGILVKTVTPSPSSYSPLPTNPQSDMQLSDPAYVWNQPGDSLVLEEYPFAMIELNAVQTALVLDQAERNEKDELDGDFPSYTAEFTYPMQAKETSITCLQKGLCLPIGGYSAWASLNNLNSSKPIVMGTTAMDAFSLLHGSTIGADATVSGTVALLAAAKTLATSGLNLNSLPNRIVVAFFQGEKFGYVGSRRFVEDITKFTCLKNDTRNDGGCRTPFYPSQRFQELSLDKIVSVLDLEQVALSQSMFAHSVTPRNTETTNVSTTLKAMAALESAINIADPSVSVPTIPPSSLVSFLRKKPTLGGVVLTDHDTQYVNRQYGSRFDDSLNANAVERIEKVATAVARTLWIQAGGSQQQAVASLTADATTVANLVECLTTDFMCKEVQDVFSTNTQKKPDHYSSVYIQLLPDNVVGTSRFVLEYLRSLGPNIEAHFHPAVDPQLAYDTSTRRWVPNGTADSLLWTESYWPVTIGTVLYRRESPIMIGVTLALGIVFTLSFAGLTHWGLKYCANRFKMP
jgi:nicastrin